MTRVSMTLIALVLALLVAPALRAEETEPTVKHLKFSDCPPAVRKTLRREAGGAKVSEVLSHTEDAATVYTASITLGGSDYQVLVAEDGTLVQKVLDDGQDHTESETELDLEDCPPAVQKALDREAHGYEIDLVVERITDGQTVYLADVQLDKRDYLLVVADDGTLISKTLYEDQEEEWADGEAVEI